MIVLFLLPREVVLSLMQKIIKVVGLINTSLSKGYLLIVFQKKDDIIWYKKFMWNLRQLQKVTTSTEYRNASNK